MVAIDFRLLVDWNRDLTWDDAYEDITEYGQMITWRLGMGRIYQDLADETTLQAQLKNPNGIFNPENENSPLWTYMGQLRQTPIKLTANGTTIWKGWIDRIDVQYTPGGMSHGETPAMLYASGYKQLLEQAVIDFGILENRRTDELVARALRYAGIPPAIESGWLMGKAGFSELGVTTVIGAVSDYFTADTGTYTIPLYGQRQLTAQEIIDEITKVERGKFFFDRAGKGVFWKQARLWDGTTPTLLINDDGSDGGKRPMALDYNFGRDVVNIVKVNIQPPQAEPGEITLFELQNAMALSAGQVMEVDYFYRDEQGDSIGAQERTVRVEQVTFESGAGEVIIKKQKGNYATLQIRCTSAGTLSYFTLVGRPIVSRNRITVERRDRDSVFQNGPQEMALTLKALDDPTIAEEIALLELAKRSRPRGIVSSALFINQNDGVANAHHLDWEIGDLVEVRTDPKIGHVGHYLIAGEQHTLRAPFTGAHETTFYFEPLPREWLTNEDGEFLLNEDGERMYAP